jgi:hypothetical protein
MQKVTSSSNCQYSPKNFADQANPASTSADSVSRLTSASTQNRMINPPVRTKIGRLTPLRPVDRSPGPAGITAVSMSVI